MTGPNSSLLKAAPFLFILTWASGFPITRFGLEFTDLLLLWIRSFIAVVLVGLFALVVRVPLPSTRETIRIAIVGIILQCLYLGAIFSLSMKASTKVLLR